MRVVVALSGGVDSSVAAALLQEQGHEVLGLTLRVWSYSDQAQCGSCCSPDDIDDARRVAEVLGIPFYVANVEELFRERVVQPFVDSYLAGQTPIPCVACNSDVKFGFLLRRARQLGAKLATGHYARIGGEAGHRHLRKAADAAKDQTYFLFNLGREALEDLVFPVGELDKAQVRAVAERRGLPTSSKPESMEICFVPDGDYAAFVEKVAGPQPGGDIVDLSGQVLGQHQGIHRYTVGQRRGLQVPSAQKLYVREIDAHQRRVVVGPAGTVEQDRFVLRAPLWVEGEAPVDREVVARLRNRHAGTAARLESRPDGALVVHLATGLRGVTPGQAAVFYEGERVLGGGWIA